MNPGQFSHYRAAFGAPGALFFILVVLSALGGCTVGPNYQPPKTITPEQWSASNNHDTNSPSDSAWWKTFHDPELESLVTRAAESNLNLRVAAARVREARVAQGGAQAELWPTADAAASYNRVRASGNGFPPFPPGIPLDVNLYQAGFDASWELDVFGGTRRAIEAARAGVASAEYGRRDVLLSLIAEVARNYVEARGFQQRLAIAHRNIDAQRDTLGLVRDRFNAGLTSELDVQQAAALLATTEADVPALETGFALAAHRLAVLVDAPPGSLTAELSAEHPIPAAPPEVPVGLPSELLRRRPDIRRAERDLAAATARIGVATADWFPKFSLTGDIGLQSVDASDWFTGGSRFWTVGPAVQWRIFDAGRIRANVRIQNTRQEQALAGYEQTVLSSMEDVENALVAYAKEQTRRRSLTEAVTASQQALNISQQLYQNGLTDFLHVLDSQRALYASQDALVQSDRSVSVDLVALYKALGGGWETITAEAKK
jgi:multidrug efflux system outer membrane protein